MATKKIAPVGGASLVVPASVADTVAGNITNESLIAIGLAEVREGTGLIASGVVHMAEGIVASWRTPMRWAYGKDDNEVTGVSCLADMFKPWRHPDGSEDREYLKAMYRAVAENFLTDGEFPAAHKVQFKRAWQIAAAVFAGAPVKFVDAKVKRKTGDDALIRAVQVPAFVAVELYKEDGSRTEAGKVFEADAERILDRLGEEVTPEAVVAAANETPIKCVGGSVAGVKVPSVTDISERLSAYAIDAGYMPPKTKRASRADKGAKFLESVDFVISQLKPSDEDGEALIALANEGERKLQELGSLIAAYFA